VPPGSFGKAALWLKGERHPGGLLRDLGQLAELGRG